MKQQEEFDRLPLFLREGQVRAFTGLSRYSMRKLRANGRLATIKIGIQVKYLKESLSQIIEIRRKQ
jgi:hypothetical protein